MKKERENYPDNRQWTRKTISQPGVTRRFSVFQGGGEGEKGLAGRGNDPKLSNSCQTSGKSLPCDEGKSSNPLKNQVGKERPGPPQYGSLVSRRAADMGRQ